MANKIQLRRGVKANLPQLSNGEPGYTTDSHELFVGTGNGNVNMGGSHWYRGTAMSGTSSNANTYSYAACPDVKLDDIYLNTSNGNIYACTTAGKGSAAKWTYQGCIKGANETNGSVAVDSSLSATSTNPVQNKVVKSALDEKFPQFTVTSAVDWNTLTTPGIYHIKTVEGTNRPTTDMGVLFVYGETDSLSQVFEAMNSVNSAYKRYRNEYFSWYSWTDRLYSDTKYSTVTTSINGLMLSTDKTKLNNTKSGCYTATIVVGTTNSKHTNLYDVDYKCTGTNDQTTIQNAINALPMNGGKIVLLEGTYNISSSITLNNTNITIEGMGRNATILQTSGSNTIFNITSANCKISNMEIVQTGISKPTGAGGIIISQSAFRVTVRDVEISGFCYGISAIGSDTIIDSLYAHENIYGIYLSNGGNNGDGFRKNISNCIFMDNDYGIGIEGSYCNIYGNHIIDNNIGVWLANYGTPNYNKIHDNYIYRGTGEAADYTDSQYTIQVLSKAKYNDFSNNYILGKNYINSGGSTNTFNNNRYE